MSIQESVASALTKRSRKGPKIQAPEVHSNTIEGDPQAELRRLVQIHQQYHRTAMVFESMVIDRKLKDGTIVPCRLPDEIRLSVVGDRALIDPETGKAGKRGGVVETILHEKDRTESLLKKQLREMVVYETFLKKAWGICGESGVVLAAYLLAMVDPNKCTKPSNLIRYCGNANDVRTGRAERRSGGPKAIGGTGTFNQNLKIKIVQSMLSLWKTSGGEEGEVDTKYIRRWREARSFALSAGGKPGFAFDKGRRKATDLFLWDYYLVIRSAAGLPVWPDKWAAHTGFFHGGVPVWDSPRNLTLKEALALVGNPGKLP